MRLTCCLQTNEVAALEDLAGSWMKAGPYILVYSRESVEPVAESEGPPALVVSPLLSSDDSSEVAANHGLCRTLSSATTTFSRLSSMLYRPR